MEGGVSGRLLGLLRSDSSINTWVSDDDDGHHGAKCSLALARFLASCGNGNKQEHKWACHLCVYVWECWVCLQHKWASLFAVTGLYGWCVHCWDKRQIHLCLILEERMGGHHFSYCHPPIPFPCSCFLKSLPYFTLCFSGPPRLVFSHTAMGGFQFKRLKFRIVFKCVTVGF